MLKVDEETYKRLEELARKRGLLSVNELIKAMILKEVSGKEYGHSSRLDELGSAAKTKGVLEKLILVIDRKIQDKINPFTSKIDDLARKYADLLERVESLEERVAALQQKIASMEGEERAQQARHRHAMARSERSESKRERRRRSIMEILKEQGILFESDVAGRIRDRDTFFLKLQRLGAIVLELRNERVAIDPDFWKEFVEKVQSISTNNEEDIAKVLNDRELRLFRALRESALIYFDAVSSKWRLLL